VGDAPRQYRAAACRDRGEDRGGAAPVGPIPQAGLFLAAVGPR
jgi:hypothetical protein